MSEKCPLCGKGLSPSNADYTACTSFECGTLTRGGVAFKIGISCRNDQITQQKFMIVAYVREIVNLTKSNAYECPECGTQMVTSDEAGIAALDRLAEEKAAKITQGDSP